ncbi:hypothetical protein BSCG_04405 [Bacteroides sp. 2_2_4]|nr:hypothetical protein BSCG_04405 [Bacteroides sp. 2_2_4]MBT9935713.1 hypothetical protein [Bacteroides ovatus]
MSDISLTEWQGQPTNKKPESGSNKFSPVRKPGKPGEPRLDTVKGVV